MEKNILSTIYGNVDLSSAWLERNSSGEVGLELGVYFDIADLSEDVKQIIADAITEQKALIEEQYKGLLNDKGKHWSDSGETIIYDRMYVYLLAGQSPEYRINASYTDAVDENLELWINIKMDMTAHEDVFKEVIMEQIAGELFGW